MSAGQSIVSLKDAGKRFVKYEDRPTLVEGITKVLKRHRRGRLWAIRHVDLEVERGEAVGVIGRNGSGKSTMLSMLAGVTSPTEGVVTVRGRLAPLLSLGVGFDSELTGRENVYINGTILGMSRPEIDGRLDEIVGFAEMSEFIDTPVKFYSSGMLVRLGFSVAISARPDILLVDEVLSVGDLGFQQRSFNQMIQLQEHGTTILVVSHNINAIQRMAARTMVLHMGSVRFVGPTAEAISYYHGLLNVGGAPDEDESEADGRNGGPVRILGFELLDADGAKTGFVHSQDAVVLSVLVRFSESVAKPVFWFGIRDDKDTLVFAERSALLEDREIEPGSEFTLRMHVPMSLTSGTYSARAGIGWGGTTKEQLVARKTFYVAGRILAGGLVDLVPKISVEQNGSPVPSPDDQT